MRETLTAMADHLSSLISEENPADIRWIIKSATFNDGYGLLGRPPTMTVREIPERFRAEKTETVAAWWSTNEPPRGLVMNTTGVEYSLNPDEYWIWYDVRDGRFPTFNQVCLQRQEDARYRNNPVVVDDDLPVEAVENRNMLQVDDLPQARFEAPNQIHFEPVAARGFNR